LYRQDVPRGAGIRHARGRRCLLIGDFIRAGSGIQLAEDIANSGRLNAMSDFRPKYITFDCYGTLTNFQMGPMARKLFAERIPPEHMESFVEDFRIYRLDEVLGDWKPYVDVLRNSVERCCR
jgi:hypothetical protein